MPEWTKDQKKAIDSRDGTILVSAAAGSGKTAVLVERVLQRLTDMEKPCSADRLLIVTFTRAATQQMKERIFEAISQKVRENPANEHLKHQLLMLPYAHICTIDSFCNDLVKENFHDLGIRPDYKLLEGAELTLLQNDAMEKTMEEFYNKDYPDFRELNDMLMTGVDDSPLTELVNKLYKYSLAFPYPERWLDELSDRYLLDTGLDFSEWGDILKNYVCWMLLYCVTIALNVSEILQKDETVLFAYGGSFVEIAEKLFALKEMIPESDWDDISEAVFNFKMPTLKGLPKGYESDIAELAKQQKKEISDIFKNKIKPVFGTSADKEHDDMQYVEKLVNALVYVVKRYGEILDGEKQKINGYDFSDISHMALKLLVNEYGERTEYAAALSQNYDEILIDEFQDINELQDTFFEALSKDGKNLFMVGDVKQSIYRFRQAMPEIFLKRREELKEYEDGNYPAKITLGCNFRSRKGVTDSVNFVFRQLMSEENEFIGIVYDENEELVAAAQYEESSFPESEFHIIGSFENGEKITREIEAQHIAETIQEIISSHMQVRDKNGYRDVKYRDICVLMRSIKDRSQIYSSVFTQNGIPSYVESKSGFFEANEISLILNLMRIIDNPIQDVPMIAVMLSPLFGFTADELSKMRIAERKKSIYHCVKNFAQNGNEKCRAFLDELSKLRMLSSTLTAADFLRELYKETSYRAIVSSLRNGSGKNANLTLLLDYAEQYEATGKRGLTGFIRFIDRLRRKKGDLDNASDISEAADVVRVMTIHKSKGLEFPICILADLNSSVINDNSRTLVAFHPKSGISFDMRDPETKCQYHTAGRRAVMAAEQISAVSEEMRVLYVAMTRAKERLICVVKYDDIEKRMNQLAASMLADFGIEEYSLIKHSNMADWLTSAYLRHPDAVALRAMVSSAELEILPCESSLAVKIFRSVSSPGEVTQKITETVADEELYREIEKRVNYEYPYASLLGVRAKSAPSEFNDKGFDTAYFAASKPQFLSKEGVNPAHRGTAAHKFMEFFDYTQDTFDVEKQMKRMVDEKHLTVQEAKALDIPKLQSFFKGELAERIKNSPLLMREKKVTVGIPAGKLYPDLPDNARDETVVIQGYVDCAFEEDGKLVVVDYKTDRNADEDTLRERYYTQLKMYEYALSQCTGMEVKGTLIYSFDMGEAFSL